MDGPSTTNATAIRKIDEQARILWAESAGEHSIPKWVTQRSLNGHPQASSLLYVTDKEGECLIERNFSANAAIQHTLSYHFSQPYNCTSKNETASSCNMRGIIVTCFDMPLTMPSCGKINIKVVVVII